MKKKLIVFSYSSYHSSILERLDINTYFKDYDIVSISTSKNKNLFLLFEVLIKFFIIRFYTIFGSEVEILLPHPDHLLSNYFFYSKKINKVHLYEDGLLNYMDASLKGEFYKRSARRKFISSFLFYRYKIVKGHLSGCEERDIGFGFFKYVDFVYKSERFFRIYKINQTIKSFRALDFNKVLFVDQNIKSIYGDRALDVRMNIYKKLESYKVVYFKSHPDVLIEEDVSKVFPSNFVILDKELQDNMAEDLVGVLGTGVVVGFTSTALVNISNTYKDVRCFCSPPSNDEVLTRFGMLKLTEFFDLFGVGHI